MKYKVSPEIKYPEKTVWLKNLIYLGGILIVCNTLATIFFNLTVMRYTRFISSVLILVYYQFVMPKHNKLFFFAIAAFVLRDYFMISYEDQKNTYLFFTCGFIAYTLLTIKQVRNLLRFRFEFPPLLAIGLFALISFFILCVLESLVQEYFLNVQTSYLFYAMGTSLICLIFVAIYYYYRLGNLRSLVFSFGVFSLMISDVNLCVAYYLGCTSLDIPVRVFYILGLVLIINYGVNTAMRKKEMNLKEEFF